MSTPYQSIRHKKCRNQHRHRLSYFAVVRIWGVSWVIFFSLSLLFFWFIFEDFQLTTTTIDAEFCVWNDVRPLFEALYWKVRLRFQSRFTKFIEKKDECGRVKMNDLIMTIHYWTGCKAAICVFFILIMCCLTTAVDISIAGNMILA